MILFFISAPMVFAGTAYGQSCHNDALKSFHLAFHVATRDPDRTATRIQAMLDVAHREFASAAVSFRVVTSEEISGSFQVLETIRERHQLKRFFIKRTINVFIVDEILDPTPSQATRKAAAQQNRKPSGRLAGAHIRAPGRTPETFLLLASNARSDTLTHELGHFFGLPHHKDATNVMSYGSDREGFNSFQIRVIQKQAAMYLRRKLVEFQRACTVIPSSKL